MRVLFTTRGSSGHWAAGPVRPACLRAGHEVLVAAQDRFEENVARTRPAVRPARRADADEEWMPLMPQFAALRLDEGNDRMVAEFFGVHRHRRDAPGLRALADDGGRT